MKYVSLDLETTGLKPHVHGITEFGAVIGDTERPDMNPITFYRWMDPEGMVWSRYCLQLHKLWIQRVCDRLDRGQLTFPSGDEPPIMKNANQLLSEFLNFLKNNGMWNPAKIHRQQVVAAGKNFSSFDLQFLLATGEFDLVFRHRTVDWIQTYTDAKDDVPPDLKLCKERAIKLGCGNITREVAHNALADALDVFHLVQWAYRK